ncbi:MAG: putative 4-hydroxybenzoate polyprenyltransferase [Syntrophorhabdaceae bacterium]|nr:putative 4-hydroxybenzoate polyprenyltransferase [Syntrophorhabdaceae bacterium]MDD4196722.1 putative 4-hydroxybenzoate polyprenyltransferase [Syntrophorhabdaceae bacterium]HOD75023.1 UbiA-like polyprenyltransferase [Syntrophorhabdaceae bacterium]
MEPIRTIRAKILHFTELVKFEHSVFALPYVLMSLFLVSNGSLDMRVTLWVIACMVSARSAAMSFNRIADYHYDRKNVRTSGRPLQTGKVRLVEAWVFTVAMASVFVFSSWMLNMPSFMLSFVALSVLFGYSFTKRLTWLSHWVLGVCLGLGPVGVWVAVRADIEAVGILLGTGVALWVAGFDIIYATQDLDFDRKEGLKSIPSRFGIGKALIISLLCHVAAVGTYLAAGIASGLGPYYYTGLFCIAICLFYEHVILKKHGLSRVNEAFFTVNGAVSVLFFIFSVIDILFYRTSP